MSEFKFSQEPELAVISIILNNPDSIYSVPGLKPYMFSSSPNTLIFGTMQELAERSLLPDFNLLVNYMNSSSNKLKTAGGLEYLTYLKNLEYPKENIREFERQLVDSYKAKYLLSKMVETQSKVSKGEDVGSIISDFKHELDNLEATGTGEMVIDFTTASEFTWKDLVYRRDNPGIRGVTTGFRDVDLLTGGYNKGDLWIVAGRPGMGKSTDMCNSALAVAKSGHATLMFSLEMNRTALIERIISIETAIPLADIRLGSLNNDQMNKISDTIKQLKGLPIYIDSNFDTDQDYFSITTRKYKSLKDIRVVFFDYVQLASERGNNQTAEIGAFSRTAKLLSNDLGITTVMYSQLNRMVEMRDDKRPVLSDLRQSGNLEEDADIAMFLYRDQVYFPETTKSPGVIEKIFRKHRNGATGTLFYKFNENSLKITEDKR
jgi:replicative DNA helicase